MMNKNGAIYRSAQHLEVVIFAMTLAGSPLLTEKSLEAEMISVGGHRLHLPTDLYANAIAWSPDSRYLAASDQLGHHLFLWDASDGKTIAKVSNSAATNRGLAFTPDGRFLLNAVSSKDGLMSFAVFDGHTGQWQRDVPGSDSGHGGIGSFSAAAILPSPDGKYLFVLHAGNQNFGVYEVGSWTVRSIIPFNPPGSTRLSAALGPDGNLLAFGTYRGEIQVWDPIAGREINSFKVGPEVNEPPYPFTFSHVYSLSFKPDGTNIAVGCKVNSGTYGHQLQLWNIKTRSLVRSFETGIDHDASSVSFDASGNLIASADMADTPQPIRIWDARSSKEIQQIRTSSIVDVVAFSPDGRRLAFGGEGGVEVVDMARHTGK